MSLHRVTLVLVSAEALREVSAHHFKISP